MRSMRLPICALGCTLVIALAVTACGGGSAMSVSGPSAVNGSSSSGGSSISGQVAGGTSSSAARAGDVGLLSDHTLTVSINGTTIKSTVDARGQFTLSDVPTGPVTLTFTGSGVNATVAITVAANEDVKITVTVNGNSARIDSEEHHGHDNNGELTGTVSALDTAAATFMVGTQLVHVPVAATIRHGDRVLALTDLHDGDHVEVRGTLSGSTLEATEVKVEQEGD